MSYQILVVEDDVDYTEILSFHLSKAGYDFRVAATSADALILAKNFRFDLILLDILLPDEDGFHLFGQLRRFTLCPIVFMSALDDDESILRAFELGADDYVVKPINYTLLLSKIGINLHHEAERQNVNKHQLPDAYQMGNIIIDNINQNLIIAGTLIYLSPIEYQLILYFYKNQDKLLLYQDIFQDVWHEDDANDCRTVMVHICNLRRKMGNKSSHTIKTVRGAGYVYTAAE